MALRNYTNTAQPATLTAGCDNATTTISFNTSGFPSAPFTIAVDRGTVDEEAMLVTTKNVGSCVVTRGYDGTTAKAHLSGASVEHAMVALDLSEANAHVWDDARDDHSQYQTLTRAKVYFPQVYDTDSPQAVNPISTAPATANSLSIGSASYNRKVQITARVPLSFLVAGAQYVAYITDGTTTYAEDQITVPTDTSHHAVYVTTPWISLAASATLGLLVRIKRMAGSGGTTESSATLNQVSAIAVPNI